MAITARIPPPGPREPAPRWKRVAAGQDMPCGSGPCGGIPSGFGGSLPPGARPVGMTGRYVPPAPATSLPWVTAALPRLDGADPGVLDPPPPPVAPAVVAPTQREVTATVIQTRKRLLVVTDRTRQAEVRPGPGSCLPRSQTRYRRAPDRGAGRRG